jgi:RNA 2',3'-cyclic 3'-phosphodiesterase
MARDRSSRPEARPLRLFVAADVPESVHEAVRDAVEPLRERFPKARWVPTPNQHVTLKFLGSTWPRLVGWVTEVVGAVAALHGSFETHVGSFRAFPTERRARVLWAALDDPAERFGRLAASLEDALAKEFPPEKRAFTPHLTVARFEPPVDVGELLVDAGVGSDRFPVDRLVLYQSTLRRPAPVYDALTTFPLGGP